MQSLATSETHPASFHSTAQHSTAEREREICRPCSMDMARSWAAALDDGKGAIARPATIRGGLQDLGLKRGLQDPVKNFKARPKPCACGAVRRRHRSRSNLTTRTSPGERSPARAVVRALNGARRARRAPTVTGLQRCRAAGSRWCAAQQRIAVLRWEGSCEDLQLYPRVSCESSMSFRLSLTPWLQESHTCRSLGALCSTASQLHSRSMELRYHGRTW